MPVAALQTWLRVQALVWLPVLLVFGVRGASAPWGGWPQAWIAAMSVSFASLAWILRARSLADLTTIVRTAGLLVVVGFGTGQVGLRPAFVLAAWWLRIPAHEPKPVNGDNRRGRRVCAAVMIALLVALCPATEPALRDGVTTIAVLLLAWSFCGDARFLLAHRKGARARA
jgi:hypothetical protein